jgi:beta-phosphoglucomutase
MLAMRASEMVNFWSCDNDSRCGRKKPHSSLFSFICYDKEKVSRSNTHNFMATIIQAVIWDLDGVILDSANEHRRAWKRLAEDEGIVFTDENFWATFGRRNDDIIPLHWTVNSAEQVQELANRKEAYFREFIRETAAFLPGAEELMRSLHEAGFAQALASSTPIENIKLISELLGLQRYLSTLVSGETVARGKPAPDIFLRAAQELGIAPGACVVIEDAVAGVEAAHAAGMRCISVAGERNLPGLRAAELMVRDLTVVNVERVSALAA